MSPDPKQIKVSGMKLWFSRRPNVSILTEMMLRLLYVGLAIGTTAIVDYIAPPAGTRLWVLSACIVLTIIIVRTAISLWVSKSDFPTITAVESRAKNAQQWARMPVVFRFCFTLPLSIFVAIIVSDVLSSGPIWNPGNMRFTVIAVFVAVLFAISR